MYSKRRYRKIVLKYDAQINKNKILTGYSNPIYLFLISLVKPYQLSNSDQTILQMNLDLVILQINTIKVCFQVHFQYF